MSGDTIWDFSGNVWEFTQTRRNTLGLSHPGTPNLWSDFSGLSAAALTALGAPLADLSATGGGRLFWTIDDSFSLNPPLNRGGGFNHHGDVANTGIFTGSLRNDLETARLIDLGFRCVYP